MAPAIGPWLVQVYLLSTAVLLATAAAMRALRQPARRLFVAWCGAAGVVGLAGVCAWTNFAALAGSGADHPASGARSRPSSVDVDRPRSRATAPLALGCDVPVPPPKPFLMTRCSARPTPARDLQAANCGPVEIRSAPALSPVQAATAGSRSVTSGLLWSGLALAFLTGSGMASLWLLVGARVASRLVRGTAEAPSELRARLQAVVGAGRRVPRLRMAPRGGQPFVIGVFQPTIVLPSRFADEEPEDRVEAALRHEWAHIVNGDLARLALLRALLPLLFAHPAYWWLRRRVRADQEAMADARAVRDIDRLRYAEALLSWARSSPAGAGRSCPGALGLGTRPGELRERMALLLSPSLPVETLCPLPWRLLVVSAASALVLSLAGLSETASQASTSVPPLDGPDCEPPALSVLCCPHEAGGVPVITPSSAD